MYVRFVVDVHLIVKSIDKNIDYCEEANKMVEVNNNEEMSDDKHTMNVLRKIADRAVPMLKWDVDIEENHSDRAIPM